MAATAGAFALGLLLALAGCADRAVRPCDITERSCQESIYYADLNVRGDGYDPFGGLPPIEVKTEDQYRQELQAAAAKEASETTPKPWWDAALALLKLIPPAQDIASTRIDDAVTNTAAFYSWNRRSVTVIKHAAATAGWQGQVRDMAVLAHELVHALQDRELDLRATNHTTDAGRSYMAMVEGDAVLYERLFAYGVELPAGYRYTDAGDPVAFFTKWREDFFATEFAKLGAPFYGARWMVYPLGGLWQANLWQEGGNAAVRHGYAERPIHMLDFMTGSKVAGVANVRSLCAPAIQDEFKSGGAAFDEDQFGASELFAYLFAWGIPSDAARARALSWRNDRIFVYFNQTTQRTALAWRIELSNPLDPATLDILSASSSVRVVQGGSTLLVTASDDPAFLANWSPGTDCP
jgi:hypothetical protein